ncbi:unnamed protein product [Closterium sp. NIES-53]
MPPRAQSPRPASAIPPSAPPLFSARPFLLGAALALLLSQAALLARLHPPAAPLLRAAGAGGSAGDVNSLGNLGDREAAVESQGDGDQPQSQEMAVLRNVTELAQWAAEIADALRAVFPEMMESRDSFLQHLVEPYQPPPPQGRPMLLPAMPCLAMLCHASPMLCHAMPSQVLVSPLVALFVPQYHPIPTALPTPTILALILPFLPLSPLPPTPELPPLPHADPPVPAPTCAIPQQRDRDAQVHAAMARSIESLAIALACSHTASHAPHASNASQSAHPSPAPDPSLAALSLPRSFRHTHCSAATALLPTPLPIDTTQTSSSSSTATQGRKLDPVDRVNSTDPIDRVDRIDPYDAAGRARLARVLLALHQSSSSTWLPPWLSHLLPTWLLPIGRSRSPSRHRYWLGKLAEEWAAQEGVGGGTGGGGGGGGATGAIDLGVDGRVEVGLGQSSERSQNSQGSQGQQGRQAVHGRKGWAASKGSGWWGPVWHSRASARKVSKGKGGKGVGDGRGMEGEGRQWKYLLSAMAFNRAAAAAAPAAASAGSGSERCQAAVFANFQWIEYMRYAGTEHVFWYDCAASDAESQAVALSVYARAGLLTYHRLHQITPPPAGADYHFDQDSSLSHFLQVRKKEESGEGK